MAFNEARRLGLKAITAGALALAAAGPAAAAAADPVGPGAAQALSRIMAARQLGAALEPAVWTGLDPSAIPVLFVEDRPGREPFVLLVGHPDPPGALKAVEIPGHEGPSVHLGRALEIPREAASPWRLRGRPTALYRRGGALWRVTVGELPAESEILAVIHHMVHVHLAAAAGPGFAHREAPAPAAGIPPEATALAALESRILTEILFSTPRKQAYIEELTRQLLSARRARKALAGEKAAPYEAVERAEGPALYTEYQVLRMVAGPGMAAPPASPAEASYSAFKYAAVWRMDRIIGRLLEPGLDNAQIAARAPYTGAAMAVALDRLHADWRPRLAGKSPPRLEDLLAGRVGLQPGQQQESLRQAREAFDFEAILTLVRARAAAGGS